MAPNIKSKDFFPIFIILSVAKRMKLLVPVLIVSNIPIREELNPISVNRNGNKEFAIAKLMNIMKEINPAKTTLLFFFIKEKASEKEDVEDMNNSGKDSSE
ncbi:hypothetical protein AKJ49_01610 [candidate division MSBL1 archaeon SCGC-AAA382A03]|uniref:Uncharacterized protein n=1 Tax=candidate division MSBL1 archaeon SCGC-AAA382A03 TaxID=1698278 RepID=A0A133VEL4_9EURY|nr:hypothetical protein AKJ49_01610 [candidate division MSBL1 archaeon SCGC-AAA382A03]